MSYILDKLFGLHIAHAMNTSNTITKRGTSILLFDPIVLKGVFLPDREYTTGFSKPSLLLDASDPLLEDR